MQVTPDYFVAPFAIDGELVGVAARSVSELAPHWLEFWRKVLDQQGPVFQCSLPLKPLQHVTLRFTSSDGAALATFAMRGIPASSSVALKGLNPAADAEILGLFVQSMRRTQLVKKAAASATSFHAALSLTQRPLHIVVPWPNKQIAEADHELAQELATHLAATFLCR